MGEQQKMLRAKGAEWIQENHKWKDGDWYLADYTDTGWINGIEKRLFSVHSFGDETLKELENTEPINGKMGKVKIIWLPSIEDLLRMIPDDSLIIKIYNISRWYDDPYGYGSMPFPPEQLKLKEWNDYVTSFKRDDKALLFAFIQYELKGLKWDGREWV